MKIIVTGSLGNISHPLAQLLVQQGHTVIIISSKSNKQPAIEALGATAAIGTVEDAPFLAATFAGADAVYLMIPPNFAVTDSRAYYRRIGQHYAQAVQQAGVRRVVLLSSWGAHLAEGTGGILGSYDVEEILAQLPNLDLTRLRPTSFYSNMFSFAGMIKAIGAVGVNYPGTTRVAFVHQRDIAAAAAEELARPAAAPGLSVRYVASDERTADEVAAALGAAIGRPDLPWLALTDEQMQQNLTQHGLPADRAAEIVAIYASIRTGKLGEDYELHKPALGQVKLEDFAQEFAERF